MIIIQARDRNHLNEIINRDIQRYGNQCSLNHIDVSQVEDFHNIFAHSDFNGDVSQWDMSNATDVSGMFSDSPFNGDVSGWDVSNVKDMREMFRSNRSFQGDLSNWNTSSVTEMSYIFLNSNFSGDLSRWSLHQVNAPVTPCSIFHDSALGYLGVLQERYDVPRNYPHRQKFDEWLELCRHLDLSHWEAAKFMHHQKYQPEVLPVVNDFEFTV